MQNFNIFLRIFFITASITLIHARQNVNRRSHFRTMDAEYTAAVEPKYAKSMAYFVATESLSNGPAVTYKGVGVVFHDNLILTNLAWDQKKKMEYYKESKVKVVKESANIFVGSDKIDMKSGKKVSYSNAISVFAWLDHIKKGAVPDIRIVAQSMEGTQLTVIVAEENLTAGKVRPIKLATKDPEVGTKCVVLGWGNINDNDPLPLMQIEVEILDPAICKDELCEYLDKICVATTNKTGSPLNVMTNGGEPLICKGELWGIVRGGNIATYAVPCASVYENINWIKHQISKLGEEPKTEDTDAGSPLDSNMLLMLFIILFALMV